MLHTELFCGLEKSNPGYAIRQSVFVNEQGFASDLEFDEKIGRHFIFWYFQILFPLRSGAFL